LLVFFDNLKNDNSIYTHNLMKVIRISGDSVFLNRYKNSMKLEIMFLVLGLALPFMTYGMWNDLNNYEHGANLKINDVIWMIYQMGGATYGKWVVVAVLVLATIMCWFQSNKYWRDYKLVKEKYKK
jgi:type III secretory pathway component EscU